MKAEPIEKPKDGLLSKTMSTKARKDKPNVESNNAYNSRYIQDIRTIICN